MRYCRAFCNLISRYSFVEAVKTDRIIIADAGQKQIFSISLLQENLNETTIIPIGICLIYFSL